VAGMRSAQGELALASSMARRWRHSEASSPVDSDGATSDGGAAVSAADWTASRLTMVGELMRNSVSDGGGGGGDGGGRGHRKKRMVRAQSVRIQRDRGQKVRSVNGQRSRGAHVGDAVSVAKGSGSDDAVVRSSTSETFVQRESPFKRGSSMPVKSKAGFRRGSSLPMGGRLVTRSAFILLFWAALLTRRVLVGLCGLCTLHGIHAVWASNGGG
jgi:hypothetical protein